MAPFREVIFAPFCKCRKVSQKRATNVPKMLSYNVVVEGALYDIVLSYNVVVEGVLYAKYTEI